MSNISLAERRYVGQVIPGDPRWDEEDYVVTAVDVAFDTLNEAYEAQAAPATGKGSRRKLTSMDIVHEQLSWLRRVVERQVSPYGSLDGYMRKDFGPEINEAISTILLGMAADLTAQAHRITS